MINHKKDEGFTLIEILATLMVAGILVAITAPSFATWYKNKQVEDGLEKFQGALTEAQRQAIRKGVSCSVQFTTAANNVTSITSSTNGCLLSERELSDQVDVSTTVSGTPPSISFSFKGNTTDGGTIVVAPADGGSGEMKCLVISSGLGIMRTGSYTGDPTSPDPDNCTTE